MDRFIQWAWAHHGRRYSWVVSTTTFVVVLPIYVFLSSAIVAVEHSSRYFAATGAAGLVVLVIAYVLTLPGHGVWRLVEQWAAGCEVDRARTLEATYDWSRRAMARQSVGIAACGAVVSVSASAIAGATGLRLVQYAVTGGVVATASHLIGIHTVAESPMRPVRIALAGDLGIGDSLPRSRPTFAAWSNLAVLAAVFAFAVVGAMLSSVSHSASQQPMAWVMIGCALTLGLGVPITVGAAFSPRCDRSGTLPKAPNASRPATTADGCRLLRTMTWARWRRRLIECRRV